MPVQDWEKFAQEKPFFWIWTEFKGDQKEFWDSGEKVAEEILSSVEGFLKGRDTVAEIGCGVGRVLLPMSQRFNRGIGVDISPTMLGWLNQYAGELNIADKITGFEPDGEWDAQKIDLVYSVIVFQHIEDIEIIENYIKRISKAIEGGGIAYVQFDTRPQSLVYRLRNSLPSFLLPPTWRKGIRRIRRGREQLAEIFERHNLSVLKETGVGTELHFYVLTRK